MQIIKLTFVLSSLFVLLIHAAPIWVSDGFDSFEARDGDIELWRRTPSAPVGPGVRHREREAGASDYAQALVPRGRLLHPVVTGGGAHPRPTRQQVLQQGRAQHLARINAHNQPDDETLVGHWPPHEQKDAHATPKPRGFAKVTHAIKKFWRKVTRRN